MNYSENIFLKLIKKFLRNCYLAYSIFLDYLFLALFRTVKNSENKDKVFQIMGLRVSEWVKNDPLTYTKTRKNFSIRQSIANFI